MSGSSLDGVDLAYCSFHIQKQPHFQLLDWEIKIAETFPFTAAWKKKLQTLPEASALDLVRADAAFGQYLGNLVKQFLANHPEAHPDVVASHGHTIFHEPHNGFSTQIGDGHQIASLTQIATVTDFRAKDIAHGGQGAPLAAIADRYFFGQYDWCLNLGGIANITLKTKDNPIAFDLTGANQVLNAVVAEMGLPYDEKGKIAATGKLNPTLLDRANTLPYCQLPPPKSLANQWVQQELLPIFKDETIPIADRLYTSCVHLADQIVTALLQLQEHLPEQASYTLLTTGGGAFNDFLMHTIENKLQQHFPVQVVIPPTTIIEFKEAAFIALMGVMRLENIPNCIAAVTGASKDVVGGVLYE